MQHAGQLCVDAITDATGHDIWNVHAGNRFADQDPVFGVFERDLFGRFELGCSLGQLAVTQAAFAWRMADFAERGLAFSGRNAPLLSGCGDQHVARSGAGFTQVFLRVANRATAH